MTFDHRFLTAARLTDAGGDVTDLVAHIRTSAGSLGIDSDRLALWAFSGGGLFLAAALRERPTWLRAMVGYYAVLDLQLLPPGDDSAISLDLRQTFSAIRSLGDARSAPPILIARAGLNNTWLNGAIDRFVQTALDNGAPLDLLNHPEGRHGFDILDDDGHSKEIIRRTLGFLKEHLVP